MARLSSENTSTFVGGRTCLEQGHTDSLGHVCLHTHTHTHAHVLGSSLTDTGRDSLAMLWLHWVSTISVAVPGAGRPWITPGLFLRASPAAAELLILKWAPGGGWKGTASSQDPEGVPGSQGLTHGVVDVCGV